MKTGKLLRQKMQYDFILLTFSNHFRKPERLMKREKGNVIDRDDFEDTITQFSIAMRLQNYARRTEKTYVQWVRKFLYYCHNNARNTVTEYSELTCYVKDYLAYLAITKNVSPSTQNLAFNALLLFFRLVFNAELDDLKDAVRAKTRRHVPVVFSMEAVKLLLDKISGTKGLMLRSIYGGGLRVNECCRLRIKDLDFEQQLLFIHDGKGGKSRTTIMPRSVIDPLKRQSAYALDLHSGDLATGLGTVWQPNALSRKYPDAPKSPAWQWLFPATKLSVDPESGAL